MGNNRDAMLYIFRPLSVVEVKENKDEFVEKQEASTTLSRLVFSRSHALRGNAYGKTHECRVGTAHQIELKGI